MTPEQLFATVVAFILITGLATGVSGCALWFLLSRHRTRSVHHMTDAA